jgi:CRISPR-associated endoribonuclease Cas6
MRLTIVMSGRDNPVTLPLHYQQQLQGLLYHSLRNPKFSQFLHEVGFRKEKRSFKLFTFSRLYGPHQLNFERKTITFYEEFYWHVGTVLPELTQELGEYLLLHPDVQIGGQPVEVQRIDVEERDIEGEEIEIEMLSPLTVYSTYETVDGSKKTQFFSPYDEVFSHLVELNFRNKYEAYYGVPPKERLFIEPIRATEKHKVVTIFKGFYITAWLGHYRLRSSPGNLTFLYRVGIGGRNSQGFGMFRLLSER